jgi:LPS sulfotransferase NodH
MKLPAPMDSNRCLYPGPEVVYLVAGTPRTGTTLLCEALAAAGAGRPYEWFSRLHLAQAGLSYLTADGGVSDVDAAEACRRYLRERIQQSCHNGVAGFKLHWHQLEQLTRTGASTGIDELLGGRLVSGPVRVVLVTRSPVDQQAVSVLRAYASGVFAVDKAGSETTLQYDDAFWGPPGAAAVARVRLAAGDVYGYADLKRICQVIERANSDWQRYLQAAAVPTHHTGYDDLAGELVTATNTVLARLGVASRLGNGYRPSLVVQRDAATIAMLNRFRADVAREADAS